MQIKDLDALLPGKRRAVADIARFLATRTDHNPNYTLLLGAGCSVTSGVRSAAVLVDQWRRELCPADLVDAVAQRQYLKEQHATWYDPNREYSSLFEKKYDLQRQRRMFVETEVAGKTPSLGYAYLTALVGQNYFNTIFTTNFDDLINEAFYIYSDRRPIVCAHDSSIDSITVTSKRPKLIKLHGDYLFDDLKSTARETESLEQNMRVKFAEFARDYGLIVVGYSAGDRSIMDAISSLIKSDPYFRNGIYWCLRKDSEVPEELRKLLWKERAFFVEIDGFDEFFAELYTTFNKGEVLPISTLSFSRRPADKVATLLRDHAAFHTQSPILKRAHDELLKQSKRTTLMSMMFDSDNEDLNAQNDRLSDDELIAESEIRNLLSAENYADAIAKCGAALNASTKNAARRRILGLAIRAHHAAGDLRQAIDCADQLITSEPYRVAHRLLKAHLLRNPEHKLAVINEAIAINPHYGPCYVSKARAYEQLAERQFGPARDRLVALAHEQADVALTKDPSLNNPIWAVKMALTKKFERDPSMKAKRIDELICRMTSMNPDAYKVLAARLESLSNDNGDQQIDRLVSDMDELKKKSDPERHCDIEELRLQAIAKLNDMQLLRETLVAAEANYDPVHNVDLAVVIATLKREKCGDDVAAAQLMMECLKVDFDSSAAKMLIDTLIDLGRLEEAGQYLTKYSHRLAEATYNNLRTDLLEAHGDFKGALAELEKNGAEFDVVDMARKLYFLLRMKKFDDVVQQGRQYLEGRAFSLDAVVEIVNYEAGCKHAKGKVGTHRLETLLKFERAPRSQAAIYALLGRKADMLESLHQAVQEDKSFRFLAKRWPVFAELQGDQDFVQAITFADKAELMLSIVADTRGTMPAAVAS
jgi:tetratricopeptide (TPR) repeat protein